MKAGLSWAFQLRSFDVDQGTKILIISIFVLVVPVSMGLALWLILKLRKTSDQPLSESAAGGINVPVRQLERRSGFFGSARNGMNPRLEIAPDGLRFKVFKRHHWPFADIAEVDAPPMIFETRLAFRNRAGERLYADLANKERARDLLRALPSHIPCTPRAAAMRDSMG